MPGSLPTPTVFSMPWLSLNTEDEFQRLGSLLACSTGEVGTEHVYNHFGLEDAMSVFAMLSLLHKQYELGVVLKMDLSDVPFITLTSIRIDK